MKKILTYLILIVLLISSGCTTKETPSLATRFNASFTDINKHLKQADYNQYYNKENTSIDIRTWKNETLYQKFTIFNADKDSDVTLSVNDLKDDEGNTIDGSNIQVGFIDSVAYTNNNTQLEVDDIVTNSTEFAIKANQLKSALITIYVPVDTKSGVYNTSIILATDDYETTLTMSLTVLDYELTNEYDYELWQYPYSSSAYYQFDSFSDEHQAFLNKELSLYKNSGGDSVTASIVDEPWGHQTYYDYPSLIKWVKTMEGTWYYDYTDFDTWINITDAHDLNKRIMAFTLLPKNNRLGFYDQSMQSYQALILTPGSQEWQDIYGPFLDNFIAHLNELGIFDSTYIALDENDEADVKMVIKLLDEHRNYDNTKLKLAMYFNYDPSNLSFLDSIDYISLGESVIQENITKVRELIQHRQQIGLLTTMYTCTGQYPNSFVYSEPVESSFSVIYSYAQGNDGFVRWALDAFNEQPLVNSDNEQYEAGDTYLIYPSDTQDVYPSIRYLMLNKGLTYVNKIIYLVNNSKDTELVKQLETLLNNLNEKDDLSVQLESLDNIILQLEKIN